MRPLAPPTWPFALAAMLAGAAGLVRLTERAPAPVPPASAAEPRRGPQVGFDRERALVVGGLVEADIFPVLQRNRQQFRYCYVNALLHAPGLAGRLIIAFGIGPEGEVLTTGHVQSTLPEAGRELELCLAARPRSWRFPPPRDGRSVVVTYPLVLTPG